MGDTLKLKKKPERKCIGCNMHKEKSEFIRVVRSPEGEISLDVTGKKSGRGAYICKDIACLKKARKQNRLEKSLNCKIPDEIYESLEADVSKL